MLSPSHTVLWLPPYLMQRFLQATRSSGSLHISFNAFAKPHGPLAPSTSHSTLSPSHTVLWLPPHLIQRFLQATRSSGSLHISFNAFSKPHGPLAPSTSHSTLSPSRTVLWLPPHLIQRFLQAARSSGSLHISFNAFSKPHGPLAPSTSHSTLSPSRTVLWLPPHLIQRFLQATRSSGSLHISFNAFSKPHGPLAPSTSHSTLSPSRTVLWLHPHPIQAQPCPFLYKQSTLSKHCLSDIHRDLFSSTLPCRWCLSRLISLSLHVQPICTSSFMFSSSMSPFPMCPATLLTVCLHIVRLHYIMQRLLWQLLSNIRMRFSRSLLTVHDSLVYAFNTFSSIVQICTNWRCPRVNIDNTTSYHFPTAPYALHFLSCTAFHALYSTTVATTCALPLSCQTLHTGGGTACQK